MDILNEGQLDAKIKFLDDYAEAVNPASASMVDANSNVTEKSLATAYAELYKDYNIQMNRRMSYDKIRKMYGTRLADKYLEDLNDHLIYVNDESSLFPYTYSPDESVCVEYKGEKLLISLSKLYDVCDEPEVFVDGVNGVWQKYPLDMYVLDNDGKTKVTHLTKKVRHRDLVYVKTDSGEDLVVTDNHPLIISDDVDNTIEAVDSLGKLQKSVAPSICFDNKSVFDLADIVECSEVHNSFVVLREAHENICPVKRFMDVDKTRLGYFIGYFIGDGHYDANKYSCGITQKDRGVLEYLNSILYDTFGVCGVIYGKDSGEVYKLHINNRIVKSVLESFFGVGAYSINKSLPTNIFKFTRKFAEDVISGIIDSDGNVDVNSGTITIRLSSRTAITQLTTLLRALGYPVRCRTQATPFTQNKDIHTNYAIWSVATKVSKETNVFDSFKCKHITSYGASARYKLGWKRIIKVDKVEDSYLDKCDYIYDITTESHTFVANNLWVHNCSSISLYPFLIYGTKCLGGVSDAPKNLQSFCGSFVNCIYQVASSFAGAVATVEFLHCFDYFARKQYGQDYLNTNKKEVAQELQGVVYALNQPASARGNQSVFWNISVFDKYYMEAMFGDFFYPDGTQINFDSVRELQKFFMEWFRKEREKSLLTFPVLTASCLEKEDKTGFRDEEFIDFLCDEMEKGLSFFIYESTSADSLSSCCRLKNEITENEFSYTLGAGGVMTGSVQVITLNANRLVQKYGMGELEPLINRMHKYLTAYREIYNHYIDLNMLPPYKAGFISLDKQFITIGVNGLVEAAEYLGYDISPNKYYMDFCAKFLGTIKNLNTKYKQSTGIKVNTEMIPAENLGVKNAKWDKKAGLDVKRDCYNSYFYIVEDENTTLLDKFKMHGSEITDYLDGGSALHANLEHLMTKEQAKKLFYIAMQAGVPYWTFNVRMTCCNDCGHIDVETYTQCPKCGSKDIDYATRVIGYLKKITNFSEKRQEEAERRFYE